MLSNCYGFNSVPFKFNAEVLTLVPENVTLSGNTVIANVTSSDEVTLE